MAKHKSKWLSRLRGMKVKKAISILLSLALMITVFSVSMSAFAKNTLISPETTQKKVVIKVTLNGETSHNTSYKPDKNNSNIITFTYTGGGTLEGWDFPNELDGVDYVIISQDENSITVKVLDGFDDSMFWANAVDSYPDSTTNPAKRDDSHKSPNTGATTGIGVIVAGLGLLLASKKRD